MMTPHPRSKEATRARLQDAARELFRDQGFSATTVRDIGAVAGVDPSLIIRYFGSKEGLLTEITLADAPLAPMIEGDRATLGMKIAALTLEKEHGSGIETVLRSLGVSDVSTRFEKELHDCYVEPLARWLGGRDANVRAGLIVSIVNGAVLSLNILGLRSLTSAKKTVLIRHLGATLQNLIDPP